MKYRSRIEIFRQILGIADGGGVTKTKIMYNAFVSYRKVNEYLLLLTEKDLLRYERDTKTFKTTEKGLRFLQVCNQIDDMMKKAPSLSSQPSQVL
jgi:predicted transcriptional regulator